MKLLHVVHNALLCKSKTYTIALLLLHALFDFVLSVMRSADGVIEDSVPQQVKVVRAWAGTFLTSVDMAGISISVMKLDDDRLQLLDTAASVSTH